MATRNVRFHGGPYDGKVMAIPDDNRFQVQAPIMPLVSGLASPGLGPPSGTVTYNTMHYQLHRDRRGQWHARTERGMKIMRSKEQKRDTRLGTLMDVRHAIHERRPDDALVYLDRLAGLLNG